MSMSAESRARELFALVEHVLDEVMLDTIEGDIIEGDYEEAIRFSLTAARLADPPIEVPAELLEPAHA